VSNSTAAEIGPTFARLLSCGFSLNAAFSIVERVHVCADDYLVVGDGSHSVAKPDGSMPTLAQVVSTGEERYDLTVKAFPAPELGIGGYYRPKLEVADTGYINPSETRAYTVGRDELLTFFGRQTKPVIVDGTVHWSWEELEEVV
jgi:hypothetical protein